MSTGEEKKIVIMVDSESWDPDLKQKNLNTPGSSCELSVSVVHLLTASSVLGNGEVISFSICPLFSAEPKTSHLLTLLMRSMKFPM